MGLSVKREAAEAKSRLVHIALLDLNLRLMENWRSVQIAMGRGSLDYESTMIVMAIIVISAEKLLRTDLHPEFETLLHSLPQDRLNKVNFSSIAAATAINRETVRRKVNALEKAGMVVRDHTGIRMAQGIIQYDIIRDIIEAQLDAIVRTVNQMSALGVFITKAPDRPADQSRS